MLERRFWSKVRRTANCWTWTAALNEDGYGLYFSQGKTVSAHRHAWRSMEGEIPEGSELDHLCRNRTCVRPEHLEVVSHLENVRRGWRSRRGERV